MSIWLLALLDDVSVILDDTAVASKVAMQKTAWILWDDLAVNAEKASGYHASREIPVIWAILKWSLINKVIILIFILPLSIYFPAFVAPILIFWWLYLAFEWAEKVYEYLHSKIFHLHIESQIDEIDLTEQQKIKSAILTDFILSIEIIVIALASVADKTMMVKIVSVVFVAILASFWVYGIVAAMVKIDDFWFFIMKKSKENSLSYKIGNLLVLSLPQMIKVLMIVWTLAMLLVAWGIFTHNIEFIHHLYELHFTFLYGFVFDMLLAFIVWLVMFAIFSLVKRIFKKKK